MKRHPLILMVGMLALPELPAQTPAPRQDPYVAATNTTTAVVVPAAPRNLSLRFEDFSLDLATAAELQRAGLSDAELYQRLVTMVGKKEARQESLTVVRSRSGEKSMAESILETIYATEYEPPELPNTVGVSISPEPAKDGTAPAVAPDTGKLAGAVTASQLGDLRTPGTPTSFETRNTGRTVEFEATTNEAGDVIDIRFALDHVVHVGTSKHGQGLSLVEMPEFESQRMTSASSVVPGKAFLIGTVNRPPNSKVDADAANRIWFAFVTASFAKP